mgnify:CR=1 FL=1
MLLISGFLPEVLPDIRYPTGDFAKIRCYAEDFARYPVSCRMFSHIISVICRIFFARYSVPCRIFGQISGIWCVGYRANLISGSNLCEVTNLCADSFGSECTFFATFSIITVSSYSKCRYKNSQKSCLTFIIQS